MRGLVVLLCAVLLPVWAYSQTNDIKFRRLDIASGLSNNQIRSIYVDSKGFAWFGTVAGLNRFDGHAFKIFKNNPADTTSIPFNTVYRIAEDYRGQLWVFNSDGVLSIFDPVTETFGNRHEVFEKEIPVPRNYIDAVMLDADSCMWIANNQHGLYRYSPKSGELKRLAHASGNDRSLACNNIVDIKEGKDKNIVSLNRFGLLEFIDRKKMEVVERVQLKVTNPGDMAVSYNLFVDADGDIWVYSLNDASGLFCYSAATRRQKWYHSQSADARLNSDIITGVQQDARGLVWVGTDHGGVNIIDKERATVRVLQHEQGAANSLGQNSVTTLFADPNGIMWVGTFKSGVNFYHPGLFQFGHFSNNPFVAGSLPSNDIDCFAEDRQGNLWIGTNGDGLLYYNRALGTFKTYKHSAADGNSISSDVVVSLCVDSKERLWVGTYYGGLNLYDGRSFKRFVHDPADPRSVADNRIWHIAEDSQQRIWVATLGGGLDLYDEKNLRFTHYKSGDANSIHSDFVLSMAEDRQGNMWVATSNGVDVFELRTGRIVHYSNDAAQKGSLSNNVCMSVLHDKRGWTWVGTRGGLNLFDPATKTFRAFTTANGLPDDNIMSLQQDEDGHIWMATLNGLCNLQVMGPGTPVDFKWRVRRFGIMDGVQGKEFNEHSGFTTRRGEIMFGGANGFNLFRPGDIRETDFPPVVKLTDFKLQNKSIAIGEEVDGTVVLPKSIDAMERLRLKHFQNVFSFEFSSLNYVNPEKTLFRYKLEGFNADWIVTDANNRHATYTNLNPGEYTFVVAATDDNGNWDGRETRLAITVVPPFYASAVALAIYAVLFGLLVFLLIRTIVRREHLKFQRQQERVEHQRMHELDNLKIKFFTNVSHEFRTPLTLILTPLDKLIANAVDDSARQQLVMVQRNGKRLLNLVNQLLDFRKMEVKSISVNLSFGNIIGFFKDTTASFGDLGESKSITLSFESDLPAMDMWFDTDKMEKVLFNLLNNAFKFTSANGAIGVRVSKQMLDKEGTGMRDYLCVRVADTGIGIPLDKQGRIFERFFQADGTGAVMNQGSGIGLALTQEFVKLHKGAIELESTPDRGTVFTVYLPVLTEAEAKAIDDSIDHALPNRTVAQTDSEISTEAEKQLADQRPVVLIVEDNEDLRFYLKENLKQLFVIDEAVNGVDALERIAKHQPMLVVTDVMMPEMDGLELCKRIKGDAQTSHIPVVMLTARNTNEQKLEGLEIGADEYITKPFNYELLEMKIKKLIDRRKDFHKSLSVHYEIKPGEIGVTSLDEKFLQKALALVEKNISNADFSVERMSKDLGVSRGHLYNKVVALTGKTPIEFIRIMRLKRAAQLLGKSQLSVSEIAFEVGFNDPKYFSKYFKDEFNLSPSDYAKAVVKGDGAR